MICVRCLTQIRPRQLYIAQPKCGGAGPIHVACPTPHDIAHARRMGRAL
jgi:hypothetical protein